MSGEGRVEVSEATTCPSCGSGNRFILGEECARDQVEIDPWHRGARMNPIEAAMAGMEERDPTPPTHSRTFLGEIRATDAYVQSLEAELSALKKAVTDEVERLREIERKEPEEAWEPPIAESTRLGRAALARQTAERLEQVMQDCGGGE